MTDYERIEKAIIYIKENFQQQPTLDDIAEKVHVSPYHFQRMFKEWAGVSPKKFLQYISIEHAKKLLLQNASLTDASFETGLSGTGRLHDLFINIEGMTPGEYKNGGESLQISYSFEDTRFGKIIIAATQKGICHISFSENTTESLSALKRTFPRAEFIEQTGFMQQQAVNIFKDDWNNLASVKLHLKGTAFQLKVWKTILQLPFGTLSSYAALAHAASYTKASRAVGTAVGSNPVAYLIPCHRVIRSTGITGEYAWGSARKTAILGWESAKVFGGN